MASYPVDHAGHQLAPELLVDLFLRRVALKNIIEREYLRPGLLQSVLEVQLLLAVRQLRLHGQGLPLLLLVQVRLDPQVYLHVGHARVARAFLSKLKV